MKTWMLTITGRQSYWGNDSYQNDPKRRYSYDSHVQNHKSMSEGDLVIIREGDKLTGISIIQEIEKSTGTKNLNICPVCELQGVRFRKTLSPAWICDQGHQFREPKKKTKNIVNYFASYNHYYVELTPKVDWRSLATCFKNKSTTSIRELSLEQLFASGNKEATPLQNSVRSFLERRHSVNKINDNLHHDVEVAKSALSQLQTFLDSCRSNEDESPGGGNKLQLPIRQRDFDVLKSEVEVFRDQLEFGPPEIEQAKELSFLMERVRDFMIEYVKAAGKTAGAITAVGVVAKLMGFLDAALAALQPFL